MISFLRKFWKEHFYGDVHAVHTFNYVLFFLFALLFLFGFQRDIFQLMLQSYWGRSVAVHVNIFLCAMFLLLLLLKLGLNNILRLKGRYHALSFIPLFVLLVFVTILVPDFSVIKGGILGFVLLLYVTVISHLGRGTAKDDNFLTLLFPNLVVFCISFFLVVVLTNTKDTLHQELAIERCLNKGNIEAALNVAKKEHFSTQRLLALRAYALTLNKSLPEHLFEYPVNTENTDLFLHEYDAKEMIYPLDKYKDVLGFLPQKEVSEKFFEEQLLNETNLSTSPLADYWLCTLLLNKNLEKFCEWLPRLYNTQKKLPRYYQEALMLCKPSWENSNVPTIVNFSDFKEKWNQYKDAAERKKNLYSLYGNTYWWYYYYM